MVKASLFSENLFSQKKWCKPLKQTPLYKLYHQNHNYASRFFITKYLFSIVCPSDKNRHQICPKNHVSGQMILGQAKSLSEAILIRGIRYNWGILDFDAQFYKIQKLPQSKFRKLLMVF